MRAVGIGQQRDPAVDVPDHFLERGDFGEVHDVRTAADGGRGLAVDAVFQRGPAGQVVADARLAQHAFAHCVALLVGQIFLAADAPV